MSRVSSFTRFIVKGTKPAVRSTPSDSQTSAPASGFGDGIVKVFEVVMTPVLFSLIGLAVDYKFNSAPVFTLGFLFFGIAGMVIKLWYGTFSPGSSPSFSHNGDTSARVIRRSQIKPVGNGELLGGDLELSSELDLTLDRGLKSETMIENEQEILERFND